MLMRKLWMGLTLSLVISLTLSAAMAQAVRYDGHRVVSVNVKNQDELDRLLTLTDDVWTDSVGIGRVDARVTPAQFERLKESGLDYSIMIEDMQPLVEAQRVSGRGTFDHYMDYNEVLAYLNTLVSLRPDLAQTFILGQTYEGRDIVGIRITGPGTGTKPGVLFHGAQHSREWITVPVVIYLADQLIRNYDTDPYIQQLVDNNEWFLIPVLNVDGYIYTWDYDRMWRKNRRNNIGSSCYGVDLNRNWGVGWGGPGSSGDPCSNTYRGTSAFSEPETTAVRDWILAHPNINCYTDLHSYSQVIFFPFSYGDVWPPEPDLSEYQYLAQQQAQIVQSAHGLTYSYGRGYDVVYQVSGASRDWVYGSAGRFGFGYELRDNGQYGFLLPPSQIIPQCEEVVPALMFYADYMSTPEKMVAPNGGEVWSVGQSRTVEWFAHAGTVTSIDLYYSTDGGTTYPHTIATGEPHDGTYQWTVPDTPSTQCRVKVVAHYSDGTTGEDASDADFEITDQGPELVYDFPLDSNPGWSLQGQWGFGQPTGSGGQYGFPDPTSGFTGSNVYGYNLYGDYNNSIPEYHLTSLPLDCTNMSQTRLSFWRWLGVEQPAYDHAYVRVSDNSFNWTTVWENTATITENSWSYQEIDISAVADGQPNVWLRWTMGPTDGGWRYCGWNIDDIQVWAINPPDYLPADCNCDGAINAADIDPFVIALTDPAGYVIQFPDCDLSTADVNEDGAVNAADIDPFVIALAGG